ncbi:MAG: exonuclease domain-containing protein [Clostridiaceae bacterium]
MLKDTLLFIDTETGGLDASTHSLLTVAIGVVQERKLLELREWSIKHGTYNVTAGAMAVNKINLLEHDAASTDKEAAALEILEFISKYCSKESKGVLAGQNTMFDKNFLETFLAGLKNRNAIWEYRKIVSHRYIELMSITAFLNDAGVLNTPGLKLDDLISESGLKVQSRHTAIDDVRVTYKAYCKMLDLIR